MVKDYDCFIFTHIPKCGGTSFRKLINDAGMESGIQRDEIYIPGLNDLPNNKNVDQLTAEEIKNFKGSSYKIIAAHSKYNMHRTFELNIQKPFYYTILRDPVKRFISHYYFFYFKLGYDDLKGMHLNDLPESKLITLIEKLSNIQTTYLANFKLRKVIGEDNLLKLAKYNLEYEYGTFGILENIESSLTLLKSACPNWLVIDAELPKLNNSNSKSHEVSNDILELIQDKNIQDCDLFNFGKNIHTKRLGHLITEPI